MDYHIRKYMSNLPLYVGRHQALPQMNKRMGKLPEGAILATLDTCSLYTYIPNPEAIDVIMSHMKQDPEAKIHSHRIGKLVEMILTMNHFEFIMKLYI